MKQDIKIVIALVMIGLIVWANVGCSKQYDCTLERTTVGHPATSFNRTETSEPIKIVAETYQDAINFEKTFSFKMTGDFHETIYFKMNCQ